MSLNRSRGKIFFFLLINNFWQNIASKHLIHYSNSFVNYKKLLQYLAKTIIEFFYTSPWNLISSKLNLMVCSLSKFCIFLSASYQNDFHQFLIGLFPRAALAVKMIIVNICASSYIIAFTLLHELVSFEAILSWYIISMMGWNLKLD